MKKTLAVLFCLALVSTPGVMAQEATDSADNEVNQSLYERIQKVAREKGDQIKGAIDDLAQRKRGFIGEVIRVTAESITVETLGGTEVVPIDESVTLLQDGEPVHVDDIAVDDWLVVMGTVDLDEVFKPIRILVSSETLRPRNHFVELGTIIEQNGDLLTISSRQGESLSFEYDTETEFEDADGTTADEDDFIEDLQVLIVGYEEDGERTPTIIRSLASLEALQSDEE